MFFFLQNERVLWWWWCNGHIYSKTTQHSMDADEIIWLSQPFTSTAHCHNVQLLIFKPTLFAWCIDKLNSNTIQMPSFEVLNCRMNARKLLWIQWILIANQIGIHLIRAVCCKAFDIQWTFRIEKKNWNVEYFLHQIVTFMEQKSKSATGIRD